MYVTDMLLSCMMNFSLSKWSILSPTEVMHMYIIVSGVLTVSHKSAHEK